MYFYEEGECITNIESAMTKPEDFGHPDDGDRVVYFQNGCNKEYLASLKDDSSKTPESESTTVTPAIEITEGEAEESTATTGKS